MQATEIEPGMRVSRIPKGRYLLCAGVVGVLTAVWFVHDYSLPRPRQAEARNVGRVFETKRRIDAHGVEQVWVPPGCFEMGSGLDDLGAHANETPRHTVCLDRGFWMDRYEITNAAFLEFAAARGFRDRRYWSEQGWRAHAGMREPFRDVEGYTDPRQSRVKISWYEAEAYARWRGGRLPTEPAKKCGLPGDTLSGPKKSPSCNASLRDIGIGLSTITKNPIPDRGADRFRC